MTRETALEVLDLMERMIAITPGVPPSPSELMRESWTRLVGALEYVAEHDTGDRLLPAPAFKRLAAQRRANEARSAGRNS